MATKEEDLRSANVTTTIHTTSATKGLARTITPFSVMVWNIPKPRTEEEVIAIFELSCGTIVGNGPLKDMRESGDLFFMRLSFADEHAQTLACALTGTRWEGSKLLIRKYIVVPRELRSQNPRAHGTSSPTAGASGRGSSRSSAASHNHSSYGTSSALTQAHGAQQLQEWAHGVQATSSAQRYHPYNYLVSSGYGYNPMAFNPLSMYYGAQATHHGYMTPMTTSTATNAASGMNPLFAPVITNQDNTTANAFGINSYVSNDNTNTSALSNLNTNTSTDMNMNMNMNMNNMNMNNMNIKNDPQIKTD